MTPDEERKVDAEYEQAKRPYFDELNAHYKVYHEKVAIIYDSIAKKHGFSGFDENEEGTGVRNYTALKKRAGVKTKQRLEAFDAEVTPLLLEACYALREPRKIFDEAMERLKWEYLEKIDNITRPRWFAARIREAKIIVPIKRDPLDAYISCEIDGERQMMEKISPKDLTEVSSGKSTAKDRALKYYHTVLDAEVEKKQGMKR